MIKIYLHYVDKLVLLKLALSSLALLLFLWLVKGPNTTPFKKRSSYLLS